MDVLYIDVYFILGGGKCRDVSKLPCYSSILLPKNNQA